MANGGEREFELINATVKDDNGKARIQTSPIRGLRPGHMITVTLLADGLLISTESRMDYKVKLTKDVTKYCEITRKEVDKNGRIIIHLQKNETFKLGSFLTSRS